MSYSYCNAVHLDAKREYVEGKGGEGTGEEEYVHLPSVVVNERGVN